MGHHQECQDRHNSSSRKQGQDRKDRRIFEEIIAKKLLKHLLTYSRSTTAPIRKNSKRATPRYTTFKLWEAIDKRRNSKAEFMYRGTLKKINS